MQGTIWQFGQGRKICENRQTSINISWRSCSGRRQNRTCSCWCHCWWSCSDWTPEDLPFSAGIRPDDPEAAMINKVASTIDESFVQASVTRAKFRRMNTLSLSGFGTIFEFACSQDSIIGQQAEAIDPDHVQQAIGQLEAQPGADAWASVTCTHHSPIQNLNLHMHGKPYAKKLQKKRAESEVLLQYAIQFLERTLELGGRVAFELPAGNQWNNPQLLAVEKRAGLKRVYFNGCALNLKETW